MSISLEDYTDSLSNLKYINDNPSQQEIFTSLYESKKDGVIYYINSNKSNTGGNVFYEIDDSHDDKKIYKLYIPTYCDIIIFHYKPNMEITLNSTEFKCFEENNGDLYIKTVNSGIFNIEVKMNSCDEFTFECVTLKCDLRNILAAKNMKNNYGMVFNNLSNF